MATKKKRTAAEWTATMTHAELQDAIVTGAHRMGYLCYHTYDSRHSVMGFPDLCLVGHGHVLFIECKVGPDKLTNEQAVWMTELDRVPLPVHNLVARPEHLAGVLDLLDRIRKE